ncbi:cupin domain-containing protein [Flagellimonas iocasae]|uniref:Cupin domain-containing protein n=1 Tax=Flagellimonas iocasae TaxID=2055905 RepID=A0ABW4XYH7_9FLAO
MRALIAIILIIVTGGLSAQSIQGRIIHNDPATYRDLTSVHAGAGSMGFTQLIGRDDLSSNFLYLHTGTIAGKSGIGHHFHHDIEEMYVLLSGEAEFTINGRTSTIKAPALVPCKMGDSHAIYNDTDQPVQWLNFAVSTVKGRGGAFDLGDDRVGATQDPIPAFVSGKLDKALLKTERTPYTGKGVSYRRILGPDVFSTNWNAVDHLTIPTGTKTDPLQLEGKEAVYYVINGSGTVTADGKSGSFGKDDAFFGRVGEHITLNNTGTETVELLIIEISTSKKWDIKKPLKEPKAMVLEMDFVVDKKNAQAFEEMYYSIYVPAMIVQDGYLSSKLLRLYSVDQAKEIEAEPTTFNYQILISFETEEKRRKWVASDQHQIAWPAATALAKEFKWRGYHVMGDDDQ